jgi:hypothetical protein
MRLRTMDKKLMNMERNTEMKKVIRAMGEAMEEWEISRTCLQCWVHLTWGEES